MNTVLVTGGAGFIGAHMAKRLLMEGETRVINLDALTYAGDLGRLGTLCAHPRHVFVHGDICDEALVNELFSRYEIGSVIHCAAESHVERSFLDPALFFRVNVMGTQCLMDAARAYWKAPTCGTYRKGASFIQLSTDEVYGDLGEEGQFSELSPLLPNTPYAASKAAADLLALSYFKTYGFPCIITRGTNTFGPGQHSEKLVPRLIEAAVQNKPLPIQGSGLQVRDWIYVDDHCAAICAALSHGEAGQVYNIGANQEHTVVDIAQRILRTLPACTSQLIYVPDRLHQDRRYALDCTKAQQALHWQPQHAFDAAFAHTVRWYAGQ